MSCSSAYSHRASKRKARRMISFFAERLTAEESAHTHCQIGNLGLALRVILDWIDERTASRAQATR